VALGALLEGWPGLFPALGMGLGLLAVWLVSRPEGRARPGNLGLALLAGLGFGGFYAFMDRVEGLFYPAAWAKLTAFLLVLPAALRARPWPGGREAPWVLLAGLGDAGGNLFFLLAAQAGRLDVAAVLSSFYPVFTVLLAWLVLKERLSRRRLTGVGLSLLAMALIALG
jgi:drug/metabolite transporter (DMT)-like permease